MFDATSGTNLTERFRDQFSSMLVGQHVVFSSDTTIIRMPLSSEFMTEEPEAGFQKVKQIYDRFMEHGSRVLLSLKSVLQVSFFFWSSSMLNHGSSYM